MWPEPCPRRSKTTVSALSGVRDESLVAIVLLYTHAYSCYKASNAEQRVFDAGFLHIVLSTAKQECWEAYHEKTAPKCLHCQGPVAQLPGRFSGKHYVSNDPPGKVHRLVKSGQVHEYPSQVAFILMTGDSMAASLSRREPHTKAKLTAGVKSTSA